MQSRLPAPRNQRTPVSPACWEYNHSRMASASRSASGVVSTRKAIFPAHLGKELCGWASASRSHILIAPPDAFYGLPIIGPFPFEIRRQGLIKRVGDALSVPLSVVVQFRLTFRFDGYCIHASRLRAEPPSVKRGRLPQFKLALPFRSGHASHSHPARQASQKRTRDTTATRRTTQAAKNHGNGSDGCDRPAAAQARRFLMPRCSRRRLGFTCHRLPRSCRKQASTANRSAETAQPPW